MKIKKIVLIYIGVFSASFFAQTFPIDSSRFYNSKEGCKVYSLYFGEEFEFSWSGGCTAGFADGPGELLIRLQESKEQVGSIKGRFSKGIPTGNCRIVTAIESDMEVTFVDGRIWGSGSLSMKNGKKYVGNFVNLKQHGYGQMVYPDGDVFTGFFNKNEPYIGKVITLTKDTIHIAYGVSVGRALNLPNCSPVLNKELTEYYNKNWDRCSQSEAAYYRKITYKDVHTPSGLVRDYFISGKPYREVNLVYVDCKEIAMDFTGEGTYQHYHPNGNLQFETYVNHRGDFEGRTLTYHENGNYRQIGTYNDTGEEDGNWAYFDEQGKVISFEMYEDGQLDEGKFYTITADGLWQYNDVYDIDRIENNQDFWIEYNTIGDRKFEIQRFINDQLFIPVSKNETYIRTLPLNVDTRDKFGIYLDATAMKSQVKKGSSFGLIFDYRSSNEYYSFEINDREEACIIEHINGKENVFFSLPLNKNFKRESKGLASYFFGVSFGSDKVYFYLNDNEITNMARAESIGDQFGVIGKGELCFGLTALETTEFYSKEVSDAFSDMVQKKVVNYNPSEYDGNGSGFFISRQGHIVTNYHVVEEKSELFTKLLINGNVEKLPLKVVSKDKVNDLAILKVDKAGFDLGKDIPYGFEYNTVDVGEEVFTLGYPMVDVMGEELKFTDGKISAKSGIDGDITTYQITTPIQAGNSGGPLFQEESGNIVAVVSATLNREMFNGENVNYAIKSNLLKILIESSSDPIKINTVAPAKEMKLSDRIKLYREFMPIIFFKE
jgi:S1-C subfamily serine protease/antitoxin component YwqK of YwqJK toxin-antitoxin module